MAIGTETQFRKEVLDHLKGVGGRDYRISEHENLLYSVVVDSSTGTYHPPLADGCGGLPDGKKFYAFQTDILVLKSGHSPRVALELKWSSNPRKSLHEAPGGYGTHDVITYSAKATRHKQIYPYLRYGFVLGNQAALGQKFFVHNSGFDFALAIRADDGRLRRLDLDRLRALIEKQIECSEAIIQLQSESAPCAEFSIEVVRKPAAAATSAS